MYNYTAKNNIIKTQDVREYNLLSVLSYIAVVDLCSMSCPRCQRIDSVLPKIYWDNYFLWGIIYYYAKVMINFP